MQGFTLHSQQLLAQIWTFISMFVQNKFHCSTNTKLQQFKSNTGLHNWCCGHGTCFTNHKLVQYTVFYHILRLSSKVGRKQQVYTATTTDPLARMQWKTVLLFDDNIHSLHSFKLDFKLVPDRGSEKTFWIYSASSSWGFRRRNSNIKWFNFRVLRSFTYPPSPDLASELQWSCTSELSYLVHPLLLCWYIWGRLVLTLFKGVGLSTTGYL